MIPVARKLWHPASVRMSVCLTSPADHPPDVGGPHRVAGQSGIDPRGGAKERAFLVVLDARGVQVRVEILLQGMMGRASRIVFRLSRGAGAMTAYLEYNSPRPSLQPSLQPVRKDRRWRR